MSRSLACTILCLLCVTRCYGQGSGELVVEKRPIELPAFGANREIARYATPVEYDEATTDHSFIYERVLYRSNGAIVSGFLYFSQKQHARLPAIIYSRGSMVVNNQAPVLLTMIRRLALEGFVVFAPMFRGSDGTTGHDELGGADLDDLKSAIDVVKALPIVDANNVFLYGESRGGMMTYFALRENWPVSAAAVVGAITDLAASLKVTDPQSKLAKSIWPSYDSEKDAILASRSAIRWPDKIRKPILIMHGGEDRSVSPLQSLRMAEELTELKREYSLVIFAGDNHVLTRNRNARDKLTVEWFNRHRVNSH